MEDYGRPAGGRQTPGKERDFGLREMLPVGDHAVGEPALDLAHDPVHARSIVSPAAMIVEKPLSAAADCTSWAIRSLKGTPSRGKQQADPLGLPSAELPGGPVLHVVELRDGLQDPLPRLLADEPSAVVLSPLRK